VDEDGHAAVLGPHHAAAICATQHLSSHAFEFIMTDDNDRVAQRQGFISWLREDE
jgi:hypothetical protein